MRGNVIRKLVELFEVAFNVQMKEDYSVNSKDTIESPLFTLYI